ncbi:MAG: LptF/LptG family permease [Flavobacteriaceae bacterium]|nr:LptF/LptG family permease [Flavobacteriaceae bacterium]
MKIIDRYILKSYLSRLLSVFAICMFIFIIQTFWLFIDELAGKGLDIIIISKFLLYYSPKLIPLVLPLSVLLASLMTYGTLSENYEFAAMKSTGISLQRAMLGLIIFHILLGIGTFYFSNHVIPYGELKSYNLRRNLAKLEPTLAIREGIFNEIGEINIKVAKKYGDNERFLEDVIIHEYTANNENNIVIKAERGEMKSETTDPNLKLVLYNGNRYEEVIPKEASKRKRIPHAKVFFEEYEMNIDLSKFNNVDLEEENYKSTFRMQKIDQLKVSIDTLQRKFNEEQIAFSENFSKKSILSQTANKITEVTVQDSLPANIFEFIIIDDVWKKSRLMEQGMIKIRKSIRDLNTKKVSFFSFQKLINLHKITLQEKYTLLFASLLLFLIGAALGAIIRKGGLGLPLVLSVLIFLTYHYIGLFGKNAAEDNSISPFIATWLSTFILAPFSIILTRRASADKGFVGLSNLIYPIQEKIKLLLLNIKRKKKHDN